MSSDLTNYEQNYFDTDNFDALIFNLLVIKKSPKA